MFPVMVLWPMGKYVHLQKKKLQWGSWRTDGSPQEWFYSHWQAGSEERIALRLHEQLSNYVHSKEHGE